MAMNSTMGAPMSPEEEEAVLETWAGLVCAAQNLTIVPDNDFKRGEDCVQMLDQAANIVGRISELRTAIHNGWYHANRRAWPSPDIPRAVRRGPKPMTNAEALAALGLDQSDVDSFLADIKGDKP